jgi:hypothetical protein
MPWQPMHMAILFSPLAALPTSSFAPTGLRDISNKEKVAVKNRSFELCIIMMKEFVYT